MWFEGTQLPAVSEMLTTWGPFNLSNLNPDGISFPSSDAIATGLRILSVNAIPRTTTDKDITPIAKEYTSTTMMGWVVIIFQTKDMAERQAKAWHNAILLCGGKKTQDDLY
jgi:hypothetical protein